MAKRRKLEAPSAEDLTRIEAEVNRDLAPREVPGLEVGASDAMRRGPVAPIAQVAAEQAAGFDPRPAAVRAEAARDRSDAAALRDARGRGLVMLEIPVEEIEAEALVRDRLALDGEEMEELKSSIAKNGLRLPIEVFEIRAEDGSPGGYGLLSGYRRLMAVRALKALSGDSRHGTIRAVLRDPEAMGGSFAAMVEENEIRADLSQFERGRIAVIAAQQGAFANVEAAVDALFPVASKAKRSKIRSFALIFEELGDMLSFPDQLREKDGLKLAAALRDGAEGRLRAALAERMPETAEAEAALLTEALAGLQPAAPDPRRGGRPKARSEPRVKPLSSGYVLEAQEDARGWSIRLSGRRVDRELVDVVMRELERLLDRP